ncbi:MAG: hypothetical protein NZ869_01885 [Thermoanaerobaculum sp.]|nr:hypothetical protein [Thermoanaerobaculum sp.]MDW7967320.1 hypothetical protein [Thermoanaerobaculum sp.]
MNLLRFFLLALAFPVAATAQDAASAIAAAEAAKGRVESLLTDPHMARLFAAAPLLRKARQQADAKLALAHDTLALARTPWDRAAAREHAVAARLAYERLEAELRHRWEQAQARAAEADERQREAAEVQVLRAEARTLAAQAEELLRRPAPSTAEVLETRGAVGRALKAYQQLGPEASADALRLVRDMLAQSTRSLERLLAAPPAPDAHPAPEKLQRAVAAFLAGDFQRTVELLAIPEMGSAEATRIAYLLRGAARFSLWVDTGEKDQNLYQQALSDVRQCQALGGVRSTKGFSPRFLALFQ